MLGSRPFKGSLESRPQRELVGVLLFEALENMLCRADFYKPTETGTGIQFPSLIAVICTSFWTCFCVHVPCSRGLCTGNPSCVSQPMDCSRARCTAGNKTLSPLLYKGFIPLICPWCLFFCWCRSACVHVAVFYECLLWTELGFAVCKNSCAPHTRI